MLPLGIPVFLGFITAASGKYFHDPRIQLKYTFYQGPQQLEVQGFPNLSLGVCSRFSIFFPDGAFVIGFAFLALAGVTTIISTAIVALI